MINNSLSVYRSCHVEPCLTVISREGKSKPVMLSGVEG